MNRHGEGFRAAHMGQVDGLKACWGARPDPANDCTRLTRDCSKRTDRLAGDLDPLKLSDVVGRKTPPARAA